MRNFCNIVFLFLICTMLIAWVYPQNLYNDEMEDLTGWIDYDGGNGVSSQVTFDGKSTMELSVPERTGYARRIKDVGEYGQRTVFSINVYLINIGDSSNDSFNIILGNDIYFLVEYRTSGLYVYDDQDNAVNIASNLIVENVWQEWTFDIDWVEKSVDIYLDKVLEISDVRMGGEWGLQNGYFRLTGAAYTTDEVIAYVDFLKIGDTFTPDEEQPPDECEDTPEKIETLVNIKNGFYAETGLLSFFIGLSFALFVHLKGIF